MHKQLAAALFALGFASPNVFADATARVVVNGQTFSDMSSVTGVEFSSQGESPYLRPGESADFVYTWSVEVRDDEQPHAPLVRTPSVRGGRMRARDCRSGRSRWRTILPAMRNLSVMRNSS